MVAPERPPMKFRPGGGPTFLLNKVVFDSSAFITQEELAAIAADYMGRKIDNLGMQRLVQAVNDLFAARKLLTAIAYIPQQDLADGVLRVAIIEGRLGAVKVEGNDRLPTETVMGAINGTPGSPWWMCPPSSAMLPGSTNPAMRRSRPPCSPAPISASRTFS